MKYVVANIILAVILLFTIVFTQLCFSTTSELVEMCQSVCEKNLDK